VRAASDVKRLNNFDDEGRGQQDVRELMGGCCGVQGPAPVAHSGSNASVLKSRQATAAASKHMGPATVRGDPLCPQENCCTAVHLSSAPIDHHLLSNDAGR